MQSKTPKSGKQLYFASLRPRSGNLVNLIIALLPFVIMVLEYTRLPAQLYTHIAATNGIMLGKPEFAGLILTMNIAWYFAAIAINNRLGLFTGEVINPGITRTIIGSVFSIFSIVLIQSNL